MVRAAHFINRRDGTGREGLARVEGDRYGSCCWSINAEEATALVGGWIYLHESKSELSAFGGVVDAVEPVSRIGTARQDGYAIYFEARREARGQRWRGAIHSMAWWSGLIDADAGHETDAGDT